MLGSLFYFTHESINVIIAYISKFNNLILMNKNKLLKRKKIIWSVVGVVALVVIGFFIFGGNGNGQDGYLTVRLGDFVQEVSVSGRVVAAQDVDLTFDETAKISTVHVRVGDTVTAGQALLSQDLGTLLSERESARANVALRRAESNSSETNVEEVRREQDVLVASAYRELLSDGLVAVPSNSNYGLTAPVISGLYDGTEGEYKIIVRRDSSGGVNDVEVRTYGLEQTEPVEILDDEPTELGTRGLYVTFPDGPDEYSNTIWFVQIPNTKSTSYLANYNAYQAALRARDKAISDALSDLQESSSNSSVANARLQVAEAELSRIDIAIAKRTIRAPFDGIVTSVDVEVGEVVSPNDPAVSMISPGVLEIESFVPEINIPFVEVGDQAVVTLDAYGDDIPFLANVVAVDPAETIRDSVSTYRIKLQFAEQDQRIKSGMTANIVITTEEKTNVITVPQGIVDSRGGKKYVKVLEGGLVADREVTVGSISSLGQIEVTSGLVEGETVVLTDIE